jgi:hypothetical protein
MFGGPACFASLGYGKPLQRFPLSIKATGRCASGSQSMNVILSMLREMFSIRPRGTGVPTAWPPHSPDLNPLDFYLWVYLKTFVYAAPVDSEEALHHYIVGACQTASNYSGIF